MNTINQETIAKMATAVQAVKDGILPGIDPDFLSQIEKAEKAIEGMSAAASGIDSLSAFHGGAMYALQVLLEQGILGGEQIDYVQALLFAIAYKCPKVPQRSVTFDELQYKGSKPSDEKVEMFLTNLGLPEDFFAFAGVETLKKS